MGISSQMSYATETLRYVRLMLLVIPLLLVVAIVIYGIVNQRIETSISSYYLGPARDLFVAMLVSTGVLLVVYSGPPLEDATLNMAGFYALFVALVPTHLDQTLADLNPAERAQLVLSVRVAIVAVLVVVATLAYLGWRTNRWPRRHFWHNKLTAFLSVVGFVMLALFLVLLLWRAIEGTDFAGVHAAAAFLMICSMGIAIASHIGRPALALEPPHANTSHYTAIVGLMALGLVGWPLLLLAGIPQALFIIEWYEIGLFSYYWFLESRRMWRVPITSD